MPRAVSRVLAVMSAAALLMSVAPSLSSAAPSRGRTLVVETVTEDRRVVPIGIDHAADWGDVVIETGTATGSGVGPGTFVRRGMAMGSQRLGTQDVIQLTFPEGSLVFQAASFWSGPTDAALLGGTGRFAGARGSAVVSGVSTRTWTVTILPQRGVDPTSTTVLEYERELVSTSRITLAAPDSTVGNLTQTTGRLVDDDSVAVADYSAISTVVQDLSGDRERRQVQAMFEFGDGSLMVNAMIVAQRGALPTSPVQYAISGGTGVYAGAAGIAEYVPGNGTEPDSWRFTRFALTDKATPVPTQAATQVETRYTQVRTSGSAEGGVGDLVLAGGWWRSGQAERDHWAVSAQAVDIDTSRETVRRSVLSMLQYAQESDRLLVLGLSRTGAAGGPAAPVERAVIGGLGAYAGASGTVTMTPVATARWRTTFAVAR